MNDFTLWFSTGFEHILDLQGYDHICYVIVLSVLFPLSEWRKLLVLITAFTIGHSLILALSTLNIIRIPQKTIEWMIPLTILLTCVFNLSKRNKSLKAISFNYILALFFGLIHGMGFSYLLKSMLGREESIVSPLFSFNLGLEVGQLIIVAVVLLISVFLERFCRVEKKNFVFFVSSAVFGIASVMFLERI
ncbi:MAG: HupE/UreJ family protein [Bacteroidota bacterium]|nr:HupE/UreJ family protein [Bacteroidota bacterium]